jgi:hypothetical protein
MCALFRLSAVSFRLSKRGDLATIIRYGYQEPVGLDAFPHAYMDAGS